MNTALLSARKRTVTGELRAQLPLCGRSVLAWQVDLVRQLGCERVVCLTDAPFPELLELQRSVEEDGGEFHVVKTSLQLVALLRSEDVLLFVLDGLVAEPEIVHSLALDNGNLQKGVFTLEAGSDLTEAYPADFERIDATRCWAGFAVMRAASAQKLVDLPEDGEIVSILLRLALQSRVETVPLDIDQHRETDWLLAKESTMLIEREKVMLDGAIPKPGWSGPFTALAAKIARLGGANWITQGPVLTGFGAILAALCAIVLVFYQYDVIGLAIVTLAAFLATFSGIVGGARNSISAPRESLDFTSYIGYIIDISSVGILCFIFVKEQFAVIVLPLLWIGMIRLAHRNAAQRVAPFWNDRALHLAGLTVCAAYGVLSEGLAMLGLLALGQALLGNDPEGGEPG